MQYSIRWNDGYEVCVLMTNERGYTQYYPLRNFGERQGDAIIYKAEDCPKLTEFNLKGLIKRYHKEDKWIRINGRKFIKQKGNV